MYHGSTKGNAPCGNTRHQTQNKPNLSRNVTPSHNVKQGGIQNILSRLDKVRPSGKGKWMACCPAHADKSPSLTLHETPDGTVLLHCFGGCSAHDVVAAVGMELTDLFPPRETNVHSSRPDRRWTPADDLVRHLKDDLRLVLVFARMVKNGERPAENDFERFGEVIDRIHDGLSFGGVR